MRRALTWLAGAVGLAALARHRSRRPVGIPAGYPGDHDPAEELRRKLADQRTDELPGDGDGSSAPVATPPPVAAQPVEPQPADLETRRAGVHTRAQEAIDLMHGSKTDPDGPRDSTVA